MANATFYHSAVCILLLSSVLSASSVLASQRVVKLSPQMRAVPQHETTAPLSIEKASMEIANAFLREHRLLEQGAALNELAYVVGGDDQRLIRAAGDTLYVRGELLTKNRLGIYREGASYEARDGTPLGVELINIGEARFLNRVGDLSRVDVLSAHQEVRNNDILLPIEQNNQATAFQPHAPLKHIEGHIIAVTGGARFIGRMHVIALDLGTQDGLQPGHLLRVDQQGGLISDPRTQEPIQLPVVEAGLVLVFKSYDHMSYALVMQATNVLAVGDVVRTPTS